MRRVMVIQNVDCEALGSFAESDAEFVYVRPFAGEPVPQSLTSWDAMIVLGGPMAVYEADEFPFLAEELALLRQALAADFPTLGICLGSQLIAAASGGKVYGGPVRELGWGNVQLSGAARDDALFAGLPVNLPVFQLHGDSFELPEGAVRLAGNAAYLNQAFRIGKSVYAVQFHVEVTDPLAREWVSVYEEYIAGGGVTGESILAALPEKSAELRPLAAHIIQRFLRL